MYSRSRHQGLVVESHQDEILIYDRRTHHVHHLNRVLTEVWRSCDGTRAETQLIEQTAEALGVPLKREQLDHALDHLEQAGLVERAPPQKTSNAKSDHFRPRSLSRRRVLKGLAVGIPLVTTILSPTTADAASLCAGAVTCNPLNPRSTRDRPCENLITRQCLTCNVLGLCTNSLPSK